VHPADTAGRRQVVGPAHGAAAPGDLLGIAQIERRRAGRGLLEALVLGSSEKPMVPRAMEVGLL